ncbi:hypothetical protein MTR_6g087560 [Medicago truncatula]|uniref:Uncharacterized protein n=1 Tax=Medicago truncatula TaxID=3880 RepID=G7KP20_MEDTR|nr:hypothetical protein MTR_6g087560 [Medicago truncatula]
MLSLSMIVSWSKEIIANYADSSVFLLENFANGNTKMMEKTAPYLHYGSVSAKKGSGFVKIYSKCQFQALPLLDGAHGI